MTRKKILIISQVYPPDPAAVGMQLADAAAGLIERGHDVKVITADRGYDDPSAKYPSSERIEGVDVRRLPFSNFGKRSLATRVASGSGFISQSTAQGLLERGVDAILVSTSPPMCAGAALAIGAARNIPIAYWVMDINPNQTVALGRLPQSSPLVRGMEQLNRTILKRAKLVVTLDEFMASTLREKADLGTKLHVLPPWPHENHLGSVPHDENPFRKEHGLEGKFVVMYSGNHGPSSPVTTCLAAARLLKARTDIVFLFVGGGVGKAEVEAAIADGAENVRSLPYQPMDRLKYSLSAADVHLVTVGDKIVGVVHPSKIYGAMSIGRPILLTAPEQCHAAPLVEPKGAGLHVANGAEKDAARAIEQLAALPPKELKEMGERAKDVIASGFSREKLRARFLDLVEEHLGLR